LDASENIVKEVGDEIYIMYDSGVRDVADVVKALALGAKFVWANRLWVWSLSIMGEAGVRQVMETLLADLEIHLSVAGGIQNVTQLDRSWLGRLRRANLVLDILSGSWQSHTRRVIRSFSRREVQTLVPRIAFQVVDI
jgi:isopentenyl diphosphate isomerase/L-lactate dehydrogenase-like FMN-dependent dehydrogenase